MVKFYLKKSKAQEVRKKGQRVVQVKQGTGRKVFAVRNVKK